MTPSTLAARCNSAARRLFPVSTGILRSTTVTLALAAAAVGSAATHMFVPGHGLTDRSSGVTRTIEEMIAECNLTNNNTTVSNPATVKWMRVIEREYDWRSLENDFLLSGGNADNPAPASRNWKTAGLDKIKTDAEKCADAGYVLRVILLHKFGDFPTYMIGSAGGVTLNRHTIEIASNSGGTPPRVIKLNQNNTAGVNTLGVLQGLYDKVITTLKSSEKARRGFYGFVIQETAIGSTPYYDDPNDPSAATRKTQWYTNLRAFHQWLGTKLVSFNSTGTNPVTPAGRLFWQMVNGPYPECVTIEAELPNGAGLCGPDTFPRQPVNPNGGRTALYRIYDELFRDLKWKRPRSLRIASSNYYTDRPFFDPTVIVGVQPIWKNGDTPSANGWNGLTNQDFSVSYPGEGNRDAGDGLANFVGTTGGGPNGGTRPDNLDLNNVIWTWDDGTLAAGDVDPGQPSGAWGWSEVKAWMKRSGPLYGIGMSKDSGDQFPRWDPVGGCRTTVPSLIGP